MTTRPQAAFGDVLVLEAPALRRIGFEELIDPVGEAFAQFSAGLGEAPVAVFAPMGADGDVHVKSAWLPGHALFTVKIATWFAAKVVDGHGGGGGIIAAFDATCGDLRALLRDDHHLSDVRTAAAGALIARHLARQDSRVLGVLGTGVQAYLQALAAIHERPTIDTVHLWGRNPAKTGRLSAALARRHPRLSIHVVAEPRDAVAGSDVVITATSSRVPLVQATWLQPGMHITAVGADDATKCELEPRVLARADRVVVDSRQLARLHGDGRHAIDAGVIAAGAIDDELGDILRDRIPGRRNSDEVTVGKLIGLGVQDLVAAEIACRDAGQGVEKPHAPASALDLLEQTDTTEP